MNYSLHGLSASMNLIMAFCEMKSALTEHKSIPLMSFNGAMASLAFVQCFLYSFQKSQKSVVEKFVFAGK